MTPIQIYLLLVPIVLVVVGFASLWVLKRTLPKPLVPSDAETAAPGALMVTGGILTEDVRGYMAGTIGNFGSSGQANYGATLTVDPRRNKR